MTDKTSNEQELHRILDELRKPFHPSFVQWKPGAVKGERALAMAYADLRAYMNRLDEVCGTDWTVEYEPWGEDRIICRLSILGITRSSTGETTNESEKSEIGGTVAESQSFKRAAAMFGLGRYLYTLPSGWADYDPKTRKFTEKAKAKLMGILVQHYRRANDIKAELPEIYTSNDEADNDDAPTDSLLLNKFNALGESLYGEQWPQVRQRNVKRMSGGSATSASELSPEQVQKLIDGMKKLKAQRMPAGEPSQDAPATSQQAAAQREDESATPNPFHDDTPFYAREWAKLTGKEYDLVNWVQQLHRNQSGPCSKEQYQFVVGVIDALTKKQHAWVLSILCQSEITKSNVLSKDAASALLKHLLKTIKVKDADGNEVEQPNPKYSQGMADIVTAMAQPIAEGA